MQSGARPPLVSTRRAEYNHRVRRWMLLLAWSAAVALPSPLLAQSLIEAVLVDGGSFAQGARTLDPASAGRTVQVSSFYMAVSPVTQFQYRQLTGQNPAEFKRDDNPVERVSWFDAVAFCNQLSERDGLAPAYTISGIDVSWDPAAPGWRLPTEAEYEFAARGGTKTRGKPFAGADAVDIVAWDLLNAEKSTHAVKTKTPNELGLYGLAGNVWEWCWDWYVFDRSPLPADNPRGPETGTDRVNRGGGWKDDYDDAFRPYFRADDPPGTKSNDLGFRVVRNTN